MRFLFLLIVLLFFSCNNKQRIIQEDLLGTIDTRVDFITCSLDASDGTFATFIKVEWEQDAIEKPQYHIYRSTQSDFSTASELQKTVGGHYSSSLLLDFVVEPGTKYYYWISTNDGNIKHLDKNFSDSGFIPEPPQYVSPGLLIENNKLIVCHTNENPIRLQISRSKEWDCQSGFAESALVLDSFPIQKTFDLSLEDPIYISAQFGNNNSFFSTPILYDSKNHHDLLGAAEAIRESPFFTVKNNIIHFKEQEGNLIQYELFGIQGKNLSSAIFIDQIYSAEVEDYDLSEYKNDSNILIRSIDMEQGIILEEYWINKD